MASRCELVVDLAAEADNAKDKLRDISSEADRKQRDAAAETDRAAAQARDLAFGEDGPGGLQGLVHALAGIAGPALGGLMIGFAGMASAFWLDAATFVVSLAMVAASRIPMPAPPPRL